MTRVDFTWPEFVSLVRSMVALKRKVDRALLIAKEQDSLVGSLREHLRIADNRVLNARDRALAAKRCLGIGYTRQAMRELDGVIARLTEDPAE